MVDVRILQIDRSNKMSMWNGIYQGSWLMWLWRIKTLFKKNPASWQCRKAGSVANSKREKLSIREWLAQFLDRVQNLKNLELWCQRAAEGGCRSSVVGVRRSDWWTSSVWLCSAQAHTSSLATLLTHSLRNIPEILPISKTCPVLLVPLHLVKLLPDISCRRE